MAKLHDDTAGRPTSLEAAVQARRAQLQEEQTIHIPVPSWNNRLVAKYRPLSWKETRKTVVEHGEQASREMTSAANMLLAACVDVMFVEPDGEYESLGRWEEAIGRLGIDERISPRGALMASGQVFKRELQMMAHWQVLQEWMQGLEEEIDETLAGESDAPASDS